MVNINYPDRNIVQLDAMHREKKEEFSREQF